MLTAKQDLRCLHPLCDLTLSFMRPSEEVRTQRTADSHRSSKGERRRSEQLVVEVPPPYPAVVLRAAKAALPPWAQNAACCAPGLRESQPAGLGHRSPCPPLQSAPGPRTCPFSLQATAELVPALPPFSVKLVPQMTLQLHLSKISWILRLTLIINYPNGEN